MFIKSCKRSNSPLLALLIAILLVLITTGVVHAVLRNIKLSGGNVTGGQVNNFKISPDGKFTVFSGDIRVNDYSEIFSVPTLGGERIRLSHDFPVDCIIGNYSITPDSDKVVYYVQTDTPWPNHCGLFVVPIEGGSQIELDAPSSGFSLERTKTAGDGSNVFFVLEPSPTQRPQILYRVPIGGGTRVAISDEVEGRITYKLTPDNENIVFLEQLDGGTTNLVLSDLNGTQTLIAYGVIIDFDITPDGTYIIFMAETPSGTELFSKPLGGGAMEKLNGSLIAGGNVLDFAISPDSRYVVYTADETVDDMILLFQAPVDGSSSRIHLLPTMAALPGRNVATFLITPNSKGVVYKADFLVDERYDLFSVSIEGGINHRLNTGMINAGNVGLFAVTPNSLGVIILMDYEFDGVDELFAVLIDGSWGVKLNDPLVEGGDVLDFSISPDSQSVVYRADQEIDNIRNLYAVPSTGGTPVKINPDPVYGGFVYNLFEITPDSKGVVYVASLEFADFPELFISYDFKQIYLPMIVR